MKLFMTLMLLAVVISCNSGNYSEEDSNQANSGQIPEQENDQNNDRDTVIYEISSLEEALQLIDDLNYTPEAWQAGVREIPRLNWVKVPERWRASISKEIEVKLKKQIFFRLVGPLALEVNEKIADERERLTALADKETDNWSSDDRQWFDQLIEKYKVGITDLPEAMEKLMIRVDEIPPSLALAQSAEESGWGTSRFAAEGNALFGQWAWGKDAMKPKEQREGMGDYGLRKFDTPLESMEAYMLNLNTHAAYQALRERRAMLRSEGESVTGPELASTLTKYSERGEEYVETLLSIIRINHLAQADEAYLSDGPVILVIPVE